MNLKFIGKSVKSAVTNKTYTRNDQNDTKKLLNKNES